MSIMSRQIEQYNTQRTTENNQTRRPANPPARLAFRQREQRSKQQKTKNNKKRGQSPKRTPTNSICQGTQWLVHCITLKKLANELKPRHSSKHEGLASLYVYPGIDVPNCTITRGSNLCLSQRTLRSACSEASMDRVVTIYINREQEAVVVKEPGPPPAGGGGR